MNLANVSCARASAQSPMFGDRASATARLVRHALDVDEMQRRHVVGDDRAAPCACPQHERGIGGATETHAAKQRRRIDNDRPAGSAENMPMTSSIFAVQAERMTLAAEVEELPAAPMPASASAAGRRRGPVPGSRARAALEGPNDEFGAEHLAIRRRGQAQRARELLGRQAHGLRPQLAALCKDQRGQTLLFARLKETVRPAPGTPRRPRRRSARQARWTAPQHRRCRCRRL